ncbi:MAG: hypothetical protein M0Z42_11065 [Actinomycetota bacterium]|nr:hypothetical protein [Actinomycetota bacterium]
MRFVGYRAAVPPAPPVDPATSADRATFTSAACELLSTEAPLPQEIRQDG